MGVNKGEIGSLRQPGGTGQKGNRDMRKITATIMDGGIETGETLTDKSLAGIYRQMCRMLSIGGPRGLHARTAQGAEIICSLYEGQSSIISANGRVIFKS